MTCVGRREEVDVRRSTGTLRRRQPADRTTRKSIHKFPSQLGATHRTPITPKPNSVQSTKIPGHPTAKAKAEAGRPGTSYKQPGLHHACHGVWVHACTGGAGWLRLVGNDGLGGQEQGRDGGCVLQCGARHLRRVVNAGFHHVHVLAVGGVQALAVRQVGDLVGDNAWLQASVQSDLLQWCGERLTDDLHAGGFIAFEPEVVDKLAGSLQEGDATAGDDAFLDGCLRVADGVLDAQLLLLELNLGGCADLDHCDATGQLGQALLQLLAVVVGVGVLDFGADLLDAAVDLRLVAGTLDAGGFVLGHDDLACLAKLAGGVAVIKVGAATEVELKEQKLRIEDAVRNAKAAVEEGIVAGGGVALLQAARELVDDLGFEGDEATGVKIVREALSAPLKQIALNAGLEPGVVADKVANLPDGQGLNASNGEYVDMMEAGINDPAKVTRSALQNAASIAALFLTTEAVVADKPEPAGAAGAGMDPDAMAGMM